MSGPKVIDIRAVRFLQERTWLVLHHRLQQELNCLKVLADSSTSDDVAAPVQALEHALTNLEAAHKATPWSMLLDVLLDETNAQLKVASELKSRIERTRSEQLQLAQAKQRSMQLAAMGLSARLKAIGQLELAATLEQHPTAGDFERALELLEQSNRVREAEQFQSITDGLVGRVARTSFDEWLAAQPQPVDPLAQRLDRLVASVAAMATTLETSSWPEMDSWLEKIEAVVHMPDGPTRRMQADSIAIQLAGELKRLQQQRQLDQQLDELEAELAAFDQAADPLRQRVIAARANRPDSIDALKSEVMHWCAEEAKRLDQAASRQAILSVLRSLGYDVRESMSTAWAEHGHVIVQDSSRQSYGVELCTLAGGRLRTQLVRFGDPTVSSEKQKQRDTEVESQWCQSHTKVLEELNRQGLSPEILVARAAGTTPVKVVEISKEDGSHSVQQTQPQLRSL